MQSILGGAVISLFLVALYAPWFTKPSMLVAIVMSVLVNTFLMAGCSGLLHPTGVGRCLSYLHECAPASSLCLCSACCQFATAVRPHLSSVCVICLLVQVHSGFALSDICTSVCLPLVWHWHTISATTAHLITHGSTIAYCTSLTVWTDTIGSCAADPHASAELYICLQAFFGFFSKLNSYWVAPMVNLVFIVTAVLTQLFLATLWGKAVLAWLSPKHAFMKVALSPQPDNDSSTLHRSKSSEANTEQQRLLASGHWNSVQSIGASEGHNATQLEMLYEGSTRMSVEMLQLDGH